MKKLKIIFAILFLLGFTGQAKATDYAIVPSGPIFSFASQPFLGTLTWGGSGPGAFNNNFFFVPQNINESVCVYVYNNNTTNAHTFSVSIAITGNPSEVTPSDGTWQNTTNILSTTALASPGFPGGAGGLVSGAAKVSVNFSGAGTLGGSPDTASVVIVQTTGNCFSGSSMTSSSPSTVSAAPPIQAISEGLTQSYVTSVSLTNPASATMGLFIGAGAGTRTIYLDRIIISCSVTCVLNITSLNTANSGCTLSTNLNQKLITGGASTSTATTQNSCSGFGSTVGNIMQNLALSANTPFVVDLRGFISLPSSSNPTGIAVVLQAGITGTLSTTAFWYEK